MPPKKKDRRSQPRPSYFRKRRIARRLAREAEALQRDVVGSEETNNTTPSGQEEEATDGVVTRSASAKNNSLVLYGEPQQEPQLAAQETDSGLADREFNFSRPLGHLRKRTNALEERIAAQAKTGEAIETLKEMIEKQTRMMEMQATMIDAQANTIEKQGQEIDKLKRREDQLDMWREQTHDALDFLLWEREGSNQGAYKNKTYGLWSELDDLHRF